MSQIAHACPRRHGSVAVVQRIKRGNLQVVPRLELAGPLITTALFTLENLFLHLPIGPLDALPPSDKHSTYLAISILRI